MAKTLRVETPEGIPAEEFVEGAARGLGWAPETGLTAEEALLDDIERQWRHRYASHLRSQVAAADDVTQWESRGQRKHREREEAREAAEAGGGPPA